MMNANCDEARSGSGALRLGRAEIELLCLLEAVGRGRRTAVQVTRRLGLTVDLADAIAGAAHGATTSGWLLVESDESGVELFVLSDRGRALLSSRMAAFGVGEVD